MLETLRQIGHRPPTNQKRLASAIEKVGNASLFFGWRLMQGTQCLENLGVNVKCENWPLPFLRSSHSRGCSGPCQSGLRFGRKRYGRANLGTTRVVGRPQLYGCSLCSAWTKSVSSLGLCSSKPIHAETSRSPRDLGIIFFAHCIHDHRGRSPVDGTTTPEVRVEYLLVQGSAIQET